MCSATRLSRSAVCAAALVSEALGRYATASSCPVPLPSLATLVFGCSRPRPFWSSVAPVLGHSGLPLWHSLPLWRSHRASSCARRPSAISRAAAQLPPPWRLHTCNAFIHAYIDLLILSFTHLSTQLLTHSLTRSSIYVPFTSAD